MDMRKLFLSLTFIVALVATAQNVQLHYDFRNVDSKDPTRFGLTTTVEMFRPDKWGNTFFFVDMNYKNGGVQSAYWEIAREFTLGKSPFSAHIEYNGGLSNAFSYEDAYLVGPSYAWNNSRFTSGFSAMALYKYLHKKSKRHSFQLTGAWYHYFGNGLWNTSGFVDLWNDVDAQGRYMVFITEPQLWFNFNKLRGVDPKFNLSLGTEWEMSYNFPVRNKRFHVYPTLALKWTF